MGHGVYRGRTLDPTSATRVPPCWPSIRIRLCVLRKVSKCASVSRVCFRCTRDSRGSLLIGMTAGDLVTPVGRVDLSANGLNERPRDEREKETGMRVFSMVTRLCLRNIYLYIQVRASGSMELVRAANQRIRIALHCFVRLRCSTSSDLCLRNARETERVHGATGYDERLKRNELIKFIRR